MRLDGKVALISGGARGMGAEEARIFAREGAKVIIGDISEEEGKAVEAQINEAAGQALFVHLDVTKEEDWAKAVEQAVTRFGKLDVLVNNAGISSRAFTDSTGVDAWDKIMEVNSKGVFLGTVHQGHCCPPRKGQHPGELGPSGVHAADGFRGCLRPRPTPPKPGADSLGP